MNYLAAAKERNLDLSELPKTLQKKIQEIEYLNSEFKKIGISKNKLKPSELENYQLIERKIAELDAYLEKKVKNFDSEKYQARIELNKVMTKRRQEKAKGGKVNQQVVVEQEEQEEEEEQQEFEQEYQEEQEEQEQEEVREFVQENELDHNELDEKPVQAKTEALDYISKMVPVEEAKPRPEPRPEPRFEQPVYENPYVEEDEEYEEEYEEDEEFQKYGEAKPKKVINKGWWLMGAGFFLLTWGAVNVFKERRG
jgi:hypothetical protein